MAKAATKKTKRPQNAGAGAGDTLLQELFLESLKDIYYAEKAALKAMPKMKRAATSQELMTAIEDHIEMTQGQVERLEQVFELLEEKPKAKKCEAMDGLIKETQSVIEETDKGTATRDVGLIISAQKMEHYEIAAYGSMRQLAVTLGYDEIAGLLEETLNEEKETDALLTQVAESGVNYQAAEEEE